MSLLLAAAAITSMRFAVTFDATMPGHDAYFSAPSLLPLLIAARLSAIDIIT